MSRRRHRAEGLIAPAATIELDELRAAERDPYFKTLLQEADAERIMKQCEECGQRKPLAEFHLDRRSPDGRHRRCKRCRNAYYTRHRSKRGKTREKAHALQDRLGALTEGGTVALTAEETHLLAGLLDYYLDNT